MISPRIHFFAYFALSYFAFEAFIACASADDDTHAGIGTGQDEGSPTSNTAPTAPPVATGTATPGSTPDVALGSSAGGVEAAPTGQPAPAVSSATPEAASTSADGPDVPTEGGAGQLQGDAGAGGVELSTGGTGGMTPGGLAGGGMAAGGTAAGGTAAGGTAGGGTAGGGMAAGGMAAGGTGGAPDLNIVTGVATMVVRGAGTPTAGDNVMIERVEALGFADVVVVSDAAVTAQSVIGSDLVVISSSAESSPLGNKLKDIEIPVLCVEDAEYSKMAMARSGTHDDGISDLVIPDDAAPLATELMGTVTISRMPGELGYATPEPAAWIAATMPGNDMRAVVFGYDKGAQMVGMAAPARRAGFAIREVMAANLSEDGIALYDSILRWVLQ